MTGDRSDRGCVKQRNESCHIQRALFLASLWRCLRLMAIAATQRPTRSSSGHRPVVARRGQAILSRGSAKATACSWPYGDHIEVADFLPDDGRPESVEDRLRRSSLCTAVGSRSIALCDPTRRVAQVRPATTLGPLAGSAGDAGGRTRLDATSREPERRQYTGFACVGRRQACQQRDVRLVWARFVAVAVTSVSSLYLCSVVTFGVFLLTTDFGGLGCMDGDEPACAHAAEGAVGLGADSGEQLGARLRRGPGGPRRGRAVASAPARLDRSRGGRPRRDERRHRASCCTRGCSRPVVAGRRWRELRRSGSAFDGRGSGPALSAGREVEDGRLGVDGPATTARGARGRASGGGGASVAGAAAPSRSAIAVARASVAMPLPIPSSTRPTSDRAWSGCVTTTRCRARSARTRAGTRRGASGARAKSSGRGSARRRSGRRRRPRSRASGRARAGTGSRTRSSRSCSARRARRRRRAARSGVERSDVAGGGRRSAPCAGVAAARGRRTSACSGIVTRRGRRRGRAARRASRARRSAPGRAEGR